MTADPIVSIVEFKSCRKCLTTKQTTEFHFKLYRTKMVCMARCKDCIREADRERAKANPEKVKAQNAKQYAKNSERGRAYSAKYRAEHPAQIKAALSRWYLENVERQANYKIEYYLANPDKLSEIKAKLAQYRTDNSEIIKSRRNASRLLNVDSAREKSRRYYVKHAENMRQSRKIYVAANHRSVRISMAATRMKYLEAYKARAKKWASENKEKCTTYKLNRRARKLYNGGTISVDLTARLLKSQKGKCACCGKSLDDGYHLDHIMPLALGGANHDLNMQLLTPTCNLQKSKKHPVDFMQERGFLL